MADYIPASSGATSCDSNDLFNDSRDRADPKKEVGRPRREDSVDGTGVTETSGTVSLVSVVTSAWEDVVESSGNCLKWLGASPVQFEGGGCVALGAGCCPWRGAKCEWRHLRCHSG